MDNTDFNQLNLFLHSTLSSVWEFLQNLSKAADEEDAKIIQNKSSEIANLFGDDHQKILNELLEYIQLPEDSVVEPKITDLEKNKETAALLREEKSLINDFEEWKKQDPEKMKEFNRILNEVFEEFAIYGYLLRRSCFVTAMSKYEFFINNLITMFWRQNNMEEDFSKFRTMNDKYEELKKFGVDFDQINPEIICIQDFAERRNLLVHNDGIINLRFLKNNAQSKDKKDFKIGYRLHISKRLLEEEIDTIHFVCFWLLQKEWRKHQAHDKVTLNRLYVDRSYKALVKKRYSLVFKLVNYSNFIPLDKQALQTLKINQAIAYRDLGKKSKLSKTIKEIECMKPNDQGKFALHILKQEDMLFLRSLARYKNRKKEGSKGIDFDWPLFDPYRNDPRFQKAFNK